MCRKTKLATVQGAAQINFYCITYIDMLRRQEGKTSDTFHSSDTSDKSPFTIRLVDKLQIRMLLHNPV